MLRRISGPLQARARQLTGRRGVVRNAIAAAVATAADFALALSLVSFALVSPALATLLGCGLGAVVNFSVNRVWTFGSRDPAGPQLVRYAFVSASSALLNAGLVHALMLLPSMPYALGWWMVRALVFLTWNFPLQRDFVFRSAR